MGDLPKPIAASEHLFVIDMLVQNLFLLRKDAAIQVPTTKSKFIFRYFEVRYMHRYMLHHKFRIRADFHTPQQRPHSH